MGRSMCTNMAKCLLIATGIIYLASAAGLSYIGIWVFSSYEHYDEIADSTLTLLPASIILGVSVFMCVIGILACVSAFKNNKILLSVFFCLILVVFTGEVIAGSLGYVYRSKMEGILEDDLMDAIDNYNVTVYQEQIDYMQREFKCCGVRNATDWFQSTYWKQHHSTTVPKSCCRPTEGNATCNPIIDKDEIYMQGCLSKLNDEFRDNLIYIAASGICLAVVQLLALISTCILVCRTREQTTYQTLGEPVGGGLRV